MKPKRLKEGDLIALLTPASAPSKPERVEAGIKFLNDRGFRTLVMPNSGKQRGYLAGSDEERTSDIHAAFADENVKAVISLRGGYGAGRLLPMLDYDLIGRNPKIFTGYSDITTLQTAMMSKASLVTFSGPMAAVDMVNDISNYTIENYFKIVSGGWQGEVPVPEGEKMGGNRKGSTAGISAGGNLAVYCGIMGSSFLPDPNGKIFFFEDVSEPPYRIDRFLNMLRLAGYFEKAAGFVFGKFTEGDAGDGPTLTQSEVFEDYISMINKPVITNFPFGHINDLFTVPFGIKMEIDSDRGSVFYSESAVD
ncbi:MAG: peptidase U61 [Ignavibacteriaceae bacterium]|nr:MAG: LD-carboxypeptidase [Chlorobiota bacterium]GJQ32359.1 MAG: peptidase U61 [Ignavibacteriaceae bacterium]